jgi:hypothetical protein
MGTLMVAGAIAVWTCLGQAHQGNVAASDLDPPAGITQQPKAPAKSTAAQTQTKDKRTKPQSGVNNTATPPPAPAAPPSQHEPPVAQPATPPQAPLAPITNTTTAGKKGRSIAAFWMTAPVE